MKLKLGLFIMCTVVGYVGKSFCKAFIFEGLARLEYRGYDSAGFACIDSVSHKILYAKASGQLNNLTARVKNKTIDGYLGIGHTRWSTHGDIAEHNAHPHFDCSKTISVVHNGIIENYAEIKKELIEQGHTFYSETDTEVIGHLCEVLLSQKDLLVEHVLIILRQLQGAYAFILMLQAFPDMLIVVRQKSPLCIGIGENEMFIASDVLAFAGKAQEVLFLPNESFAFVFKDHIKLYDFSGKSLIAQTQKIDIYFELTHKDQYAHFMLKEIYQQKDAIINTINSLSLSDLVLLNQNIFSTESIKNINRVCFIACGTSWHAAQIGKFFIESIVHIPVEVHIASEFRYRSFFPDKNALYIFISQSGETADTLEALRLVNAHSLNTLALTNVATSTIVREAQSFLLTSAGPEVAVASTKAFSTQLAALYWFAHYQAYEKNIISLECFLQAETNLLSVAHLLEDSINKYKTIIDTSIANRYAQYDKALFLGRHISYPLAMEAALKLKEIAYVFAQSYPAGELKHGPLALVDNKMLVYIFSHNDSVIYQKLLSNAYEVKARGGTIIAFAYQDQDELCALAETAFIIENDVPSLLGPLAMIGLAQYFVYAIAKERGCPIDKPRNLAKSVTVE